MFSHSTKRGDPGRALVDGKDTLVINWGPDWPTTVVGGTTVEVHGNLVAKKDVSIAGATLVVRENDNIKARRAGTEATGGCKIMLELHQEDSGPPKVPEVGTAIRFHHGSRYWHRIEGRGDGLHVRDGHPDSNDWHSLYAGNMFTNGLQVTAGATERLRIIRGTIGTNCNTVRGSGFRAWGQGKLCKIQFSPAFSDAPTVVVCQQYPDSDDDNRTDGGNTRDNAVVVSVSREYALIKTGDGDGDHAWRRFQFIAVGPY
jgi:hypothetical protein